MKKILLACITVILTIIFSCNGKQTCLIDKWPKGEIHYRYRGNFTEKEIKIIKIAMNEWETVSKAKIKFIYAPKRHAATVYTILKTTQNLNYSSSTIGYGKYTYLKTSIVLYDVILHELGHCLGLVHEHQRPDRDEHIKVLWKNIYKEHQKSFLVLKDDMFLYNYKMIPYDYLSIMHYHSHAFSKNGEPVILPKKRIKLSGYRVSEYDGLKIRMIYGGK